MSYDILFFHPFGAGDPLDEGHRLLSERDHPTPNPQEEPGACGLSLIY
jgi:hypothetical protein